LKYSGLYAKHVQVRHKRFEIMKKLLLTLTISSLSFGVASSASAQTEGTVLGGTLTTGATVGLVAAAGVLAIALGGSSDGTTTTTTTGTN
jgi:hypothetical protein